MLHDEHDEDDLQHIKSPIKRYGSTRKIYLFNSEYLKLMQFIKLTTGPGRLDGRHRRKIYSFISRCYCRRDRKVKLAARFICRHSLIRCVFDLRMHVNHSECRWSIHKVKRERMNCEKWKIYESLNEKCEKHTQKICEKMKSIGTQERPQRSIKMFTYTQKKKVDRNTNWMRVLTWVKILPIDESLSESSFCSHAEDDAP